MSIESWCWMWGATAGVLSLIAAVVVYLFEREKIEAGGLRTARDQAQAELSGSRIAYASHAANYAERYSECVRLNKKAAEWQIRANEAADLLLKCGQTVTWRDLHLQTVAFQLGQDYQSVQYRHQLGDPEITHARWQCKERNFGARGGMTCPEQIADAWRNPKISFTLEQAEKMVRDLDCSGRAEVKGVNFGARRMRRYPTAAAAAAAAEVDVTYIEIDTEQILCDTHPWYKAASDLAKADAAEREAKRELDRISEKYTAIGLATAVTVDVARQHYNTAQRATAHARKAYAAELAKLRPQVVTVTL